MELKEILFLVAVNIGFVPLFITRPWIGIIGLLFLQIPLASSTEAINLFEISYALWFFVVMLGWLLKCFVFKLKRPPSTSLNLPILAFFSYVIFTFFQPIFNNIDLLDSLRQWSHFSSLLLFFPIVTEFEKNKKLKILIYSFLMVSTIICLYAICWNLIFGSGLKITEMGAEKEGSPFSSILYLSGTILLISMYSYTRNIPTRFIFILLLLIHFWRAIIGFRRHPALIILFAVILILFFALQQKDRIPITRHTKLIVFFILLSIFSIYFGNLDDYLARFAGISRGMESRTLVLSESLNRFFSLFQLRNLIFGRGFGLREGYTVLLRGKLHFTGTVHNVYVYLLIRIGFIGLFLYLWISLKGIHEGWNLTQRLRDNYWKGISLGLTVGLIAMSVSTLANSKGTRIDFSLFIAMSLGVTCILSRKKAIEPSL